MIFQNVGVVISKSYLLDGPAFRIIRISAQKQLLLVDSRKCGDTYRVIRLRSRTFPRSSIIPFSTLGVMHRLLLTSARSNINLATTLSHVNHKLFFTLCYQLVGSVALSCRLHRHGALRLRAFSDWGYQGQAVPRIRCRSRGSLASLRGRRMVAAGWGQEGEASQSVPRPSRLCGPRAPDSQRDRPAHRPYGNNVAPPGSGGNWHSSRHAAAGAPVSSW